MYRFGLVPHVDLKKMLHLFIVPIIESTPKALHVQVIQALKLKKFPQTCPAIQITLNYLPGGFLNILSYVDGHIKLRRHSLSCGHSLKLNFCMFEKSQVKHNNLDYHNCF
jgi:hypothetical protein